MQLVNYGSDLLQEIIPLYGVAIVLFTIGMLLKRAFGGRDQIVTLKLR